MTEKDRQKNEEAEVAASKRRADKLQEINNDMSKGMDPAMEKLLAEIEERNKIK